MIYYFHYNLVPYFSFVFTKKYNIMKKNSLFNIRILCESWLAHYSKRESILSKIVAQTRNTHIVVAYTATCFLHFSSSSPAYRRQNLVKPDPTRPLSSEMDDYLKQFVEETSFYNRLVLGTFMPESWWGPLPHMLQGWLRNYIGGVLLYFISGFLWCFYIYHLKRNVYIPKGKIFSLPCLCFLFLNFFYLNLWCVVFACYSIGE